MSVSVTYIAQVTTVETLETSVPAAASNGKSITHSGYNSSGTYTSSTTVPVTKCAYFSKALSSGAATIDLTALTGTNGGTVDGTGLKLQFAHFKNPSSNGNAITVTFGASNGYLLGGAAWKWVLSPGQEITVFGNDAAPDISSSAKNIDLAGTGSQALECSIVVG